MTDALTRLADAVEVDDGWLIYKAGRGWYRPNAQGYASLPSEAGRYTLSEAIAHSHPNGPDGPRDGITIKHESALISNGRRKRRRDRIAELETLLARQLVFDHGAAEDGLDALGGWNRMCDLVTAYREVNPLPESDIEIPISGEDGGIAF